jgi:hypothetical protein
MLDEWEKKVVEECRRRITADPSDKLAREVLADVPEAIEGTSTSFSWFFVKVSQ